MSTLPLKTSPVTEEPAASPQDALAHFESLLSFETDCWDTHASLSAGDADFVVLDVRSPEAYATDMSRELSTFPTGELWRAI
jgi:hypothetical protein